MGTEVNQKAGFDWTGATGSISSWWDEAKDNLKTGSIVALQEYAKREIGRINPPLQQQVQNAHLDQSQTQRPAAQPSSTFDAMKDKAAVVQAKAAGVPLGVWLAVGGGLALAVWWRK